eukprot:TRINITY_DN13293_c0_g1_i1.p1 TRINITY_DN13293_c0_g1~~TRINITY_DN13293_c0_g1_i1.p1  ORF type:complete len:530 (-),score=85.30 TRINITY_DN13293_c0_g1_i1:56-1588(-)
MSDWEEPTPPPPPIPANIVEDTLVVQGEGPFLASLDLNGPVREAIVTISESARWSHPEVCGPLKGVSVCVGVPHRLFGFAGDRFVWIDHLDETLVSHILSHDGDEVVDACLALTGDYVICTLKKKGPEIWRIQTRELSQAFFDEDSRDQSAGFNSIDLSQENRIILTLNESREATLWNTLGVPKLSVPHVRGHIIRLLPNTEYGCVIAAGSSVVFGKFITGSRMLSRRVINECHRGHITQLVPFPLHCAMVSACDGGTVIVWEYNDSTHRCLARFSVNGPVLSLAIAFHQLAVLTPNGVVLFPFSFEGLTEFDPQFSLFAPNRERINTPLTGSFSIDTPCYPPTFFPLANACSLTWNVLWQPNMKEDTQLRLLCGLNNGALAILSVTLPKTCEMWKAPLDLPSLSVKKPEEGESLALKDLFGVRFGAEEGEKAAEGGGVVRYTPHAERVTIPQRFYSRYLQIIASNTLYVLWSREEDNMLNYGLVEREHLRIVCMHLRSMNEFPYERVSS